MIKKYENTNYNSLLYNKCLQCIYLKFKICNIRGDCKLRGFENVRLQKNVKYKRVMQVLLN